MTQSSTPLAVTPGWDLVHYPPSAGTPALAADISATQQKTVNALGQIRADGYLGAGLPTPITGVATEAALRALTGMPNGAVAYITYGRSLWRFYLGVSATNSFHEQNADDASGLWVRLETSNPGNLHGTLPTAPSDVQSAPMYSGRSLAVSLGSQVAINHAAGTPGTSYSTGSPTVVMSCQAPAVAFTDAVRVGDIITCDVTLYLSYTYISGTPAELSTRVSVAFQLGGSTVSTQTMADAVSVSSVYSGGANPTLGKIVNAQFSYTAAVAATSATCVVSLQKVIVASGDASTSLHTLGPSNVRVSVSRP